MGVGNLTIFVKNPDTPSKLWIIMDKLSIIHRTPGLVPVGLIETLLLRWLSTGGSIYLDREVTK